MERGPLLWPQPCPNHYSTSLNLAIHQPTHCPPEIPLSKIWFLSAGIVGPADFCNSMDHDEESQKIKVAVSRLRDLEHSQMETTLLWSCIAISKFIMALLSCPPGHIRNLPLPLTIWFKKLCLTLVCYTRLGLAQCFPSNSLGGLNLEVGLTTCTCSLHQFTTPILCKNCR